MKQRQALIVRGALLALLAACLANRELHGQKPADPSKFPMLVSAEGQRTYREAVFEGDFGIPRVDEITEMQAELYQCISRRPDVAPFVVPQESYAAILAKFEHGIIQRDPILSMPEIGTLRIRTKDGSIRRICIYGGAHSPLMFSIHGVRCIVDRPATDFRDESIVFEGQIRRARASRDEVR